MIGLLNPTSFDPNTDNLRGFRQGLEEVGFVEGENVSILVRSAENQIDQLPVLADDPVRRRVAVIATIGQSSAFAAKSATTTIPILFIAAEDPVALGLVTSLARPGGNLTGVTRTGRGEPVFAVLQNTAQTAMMCSVDARRRSSRVTEVC